jgi:hypothetical protein
MQSVRATASVIGRRQPGGLALRHGRAMDHPDDGHGARACPRRVTGIVNRRKLLLRPMRVLISSRSGPKTHGLDDAAWSPPCVEGAGCSSDLRGRR